MTPLNIEFGCGPNITRGFVGCDIRDTGPHVRYVCNAWEIGDHVGASEVDHIYSRHFLEHLTFYQAGLTFRAWHQILKPGGVLTIVVPDMLFHIKQWLNPKRSTDLSPSGQTEEERAIEGFWGKQRDFDSGEVWDLHKSGYDERLLEHNLKRYGYHNIKRVSDNPKNLHMRAAK